MNLSHPDAVSGNSSDVRVMRSAAGWYIGTSWHEYNADGKLIWSEPNSRESGYFDTEEEADAVLQSFRD